MTSHPVRAGCSGYAAVSRCIAVDSRGASFAEYAVLLALVLVAALTCVNTFGARLRQAFAGDAPPTSQHRAPGVELRRDGPSTGRTLEVTPPPPLDAVSLHVHDHPAPAPFTGMTRAGRLTSLASTASSRALQPRAGGNTDLEDPEAHLRREQRERWLDAVLRGLIRPKPHTRLGAVAATRGYRCGTVGHAVHLAIRQIYRAFGIAGEERIGEFFESEDVKRLLRQDLTKGSSREIAEKEFKYWTSVLRENPQSLGGRMGVYIEPGLRDWIQRHVYGRICVEAKVGAADTASW